MIRIDEQEIRQDLGTPTEANGFFSSDKLAGIRLDLQNLGPEDQKIIEDLTSRETVSIKDPFTGKEYQASIRQASNSFTVGQDAKSYVVEIIEIDVYPNVEELEINEETFRVIQYQEYETDGEIGRNAILLLDREQFISLRSMLSLPELTVRRIGVDEEPLKLRFGARMFWSEHEDKEEKYWKHIVRLFPVGKQPSSSLDLASGVIQDNLSAQVIQLSLRLNALISALSESDAITEQTKEELLGTGWRDEVDPSELNRLWDRLEKIRDAEEYGF